MGPCFAIIKLRKGVQTLEYTQIKVSSKDDPKRFNRMIAIKGDPNLMDLGAIIGLSVNAWFEHCYLFRIPKQKKTFVFDSWLDDFIADDNEFSMTSSHFSDLGESFIYEYDTGEGYEFDCKVLKRKKECLPDDDEEYPVAFVVKGVGQGIFENDHRALWAYLAGLIDPESGNDEENWIFLPMNMDFEKFGDFDKPLDLNDYVYYQEDIDSVIME